MNYNFDPNLPIYVQVMDEIKKEVFSGKYKRNDKIASVRELALQFGVNPNTIQKGLVELEREGLLRSERAIGRFVTDDGERIEAIKQQLSQSLVAKFMEEMKSLGYSVDEIISKIESNGELS